VDMSTKSSVHGMSFQNGLSKLPSIVIAGSSAVEVTSER